MIVRLLGMLLLVSLTFSGSLHAAEQVITIIVGEHRPAHAEALAHLRREIERTAATGVTIRLAESSDAEAMRAPATVVVAIGTRAMQAAIAADVAAPTITVMVPQAVYEKARARGAGRRASAVFIDQPLGRQLDLIAEALPENRHLGVITGPESAYWSGALQAAVRERDLSLSIAHAAAEREIFPALQKVLTEARVLLVLPDPQVYNGSTIHDVLLTAYRRGVPLVGYSSAYTRAGALLAVYSTPEQIAVQATEMVRQILAGRPLPTPQHPNDFRISVNRQVAQSLGLKVAGEDELVRRLQQREARE